MAVRVLMILLSIIIVINVVILLLSAITGKNVYKEYGKQIVKVFSSFLCCTFINRVKLKEICYEQYV